MSEFKMQCTGNNVAILLLRKERTTRTAGFERTDRKGEQAGGWIMAIGPGTKDRPMTREVGEYVAIPKRGGMEWREGQDQYAIVHQDDIRLYQKAIDCKDEFQSAIRS